MIAISIERLRLAADNQPNSYFQDVISHGKIKGGTLLIDASLYAALRAKYSRPSIARKAINFAGATARVTKAAATGKRVTVSDQERERRLTICAGDGKEIKKCDFYTGTTCRKCGCVIRFKAKLATEHCPINKW